MTPLLEVRDLTTRFHTDEGIVHAVDDVGFTLGTAERLALVGESGSGKTVTALSLLGLIDPPGRIEAGEILLRGHDLRTLSEGEYRHVRGSEIAMVFQDPLATLNPVMTVGAHLVEVLRVHRNLPRRVARDRAAELLARVGIPQAASRLGDYPHQFSGGMRQRVGIAIALACDPSVLIADEPTTALDVTIQAQILDLLRSLTEERGLAVLLITHDLGVVAEFCDEVAVMYAGRLVERASATTILGGGARHPYTRSLLGAISRLDQPRPPSKRVRTIAGSPPDILDLPGGCAFEPRCYLARQRERCRRERPQMANVRAAGEHDVACHFASETAGPA